MEQEAKRGQQFCWWFWATKRCWAPTNSKPNSKVWNCQKIREFILIVEILFRLRHIYNRNFKAVFSILFQYKSYVIIPVQTTVYFNVRPFAIAVAAAKDEGYHRLLIHQMTNSQQTTGWYTFHSHILKQLVHFFDVVRISYWLEEKCYFSLFSRKRRKASSSESQESDRETSSTVSFSTPGKRWDTNSMYMHRTCTMNAQAYF